MKRYILIIIPIIVFVAFDAILITDFIRSRQEPPKPEVQGIADINEDEYVITPTPQTEPDPTRITPTPVMVEIIDKRNVKILSSEEPTDTPTPSPTPSLTPSPTDPTPTRLIFN